MRPEPFTDALARLLHCYYPSGLRNDDPRYKESKEAQRLSRLIRVQPSPNPLLPPEFQAHEAKLAGLIESTLGFSRLSAEVLFTPVPDLVPRTANHGPSEALLIDCFFTWDRW
jgi:hypothetical protein